MPSRAKERGSKADQGRPAFELAHIGAYLRRARFEREATLQHIARQAGIHVTELSKVESGHRLPTLAQAVSLARALAIPLQVLLSGSVRPAEMMQDLALELRSLGIVDLLAPDAHVPGAFRRVEEVLALVLKGDRPAPRIIEALPAVLAWNVWDAGLIMAFARVHDDRVAYRTAWLADIALAIEEHGGFPGGCVAQDQMEKLRREAIPSRVPDDLGYPKDGFRLPPVSRRWRIEYPATLDTFRTRALKLHELGQAKPTRRGRRSR